MKLPKVVYDLGIHQFKSMIMAIHLDERDSKRARQRRPIIILMGFGPLCRALFRHLTDPTGRPINLSSYRDESP